MGVDARILIRYFGTKPTDDQLLQWSFDLCKTFGASNFLFMEGIADKEKAKQLQEIWHRDYTGPAYREQNPYPQSRQLALDFSDDGRHYYQDGPDLTANPNEWFLKVNLSGRYYGPCYERGDIILYCSIAEWCEINLKPCEVWYGGDSSGICVEPFDEFWRRDFRKHLYSSQGRDYFSCFGSSDGPRPPKCSICPPGPDRRTQDGWGENYTKIHCSGCGKTFETRNHGESWETTNQ